MITRREFGTLGRVNLDSRLETSLSFSLTKRWDKDRGNNSVTRDERFDSYHFPAFSRGEKNSKITFERFVIRHFTSLSIGRVFRFPTVIDNRRIHFELTSSRSSLSLLILCFKVYRNIEVPFIRTRRTQEEVILQKLSFADREFSRPALSWVRRRSA